MPTSLYIFRHAWACEPDVERWPDDGFRPLTKEGARRFRAVARALAQRGCRPEAIATSPLTRCRQTADLLAAELLAAGLPARPLVVETPALAPGSNLRTLLDWSAGQPAESIAWVGHAPDVGELLAALLGNKLAAIRFAKGAVGCARFAGPVAAGQGELQWLVTAKMLGC